MAQEVAQAKEWREERQVRAWALKAQGWSQEKIAEALGVTAGAVSQWMRRGREADYPTGLRSRERGGGGVGEGDEVGACAVEPAEAEGEETEGAAILPFEDAAGAVLEDEEALDEDEEG